MRAWPQAGWRRASCTACSTPTISRITGESFDYGPWRFLPTSDPSFTAAYFDEHGLYAFGRQPEAVSWALMQLAGALSLACPIPALEAALAEFGPAYQKHLRQALFARLGLSPGKAETDLAFMQDMFAWLSETQIGWDQFFHDWIGADAARAAQSPQAGAYAAASFHGVRAGLEARAIPAPLHPYFERLRPVSLLIDEVEKLWAGIAERDDWSLFEAKLSELDILRVACHGIVAKQI